MSGSDTRAASTVDSQAAERIPLPAEVEDVATLRRSIVAKLTYHVGKTPIVATERDWFVATALAVRDTIVDSWFDSTRAPTKPGQAGLLPVAGVPDRPAAVRQPRQPGPDGAGARGAGAEGVDLDRLRERSRTRRWATAASAGSPPASWKAWRRWASPPTATASATSTACSARSSRRRAAGTARGLADLRQPLGVRAAGSRLSASASAARRSPPRPGGRQRATSGIRPRRSGRRLRHARRSAGGGAARQHAAAVVGPRPDAAAPRGVQPRRPRGRPARPRARRRRSPACCIPATRATPARSCGCARSSSSPPPRCRTCCAATCEQFGTSATCRTRPRSSSTTPTRRSPSPS